MLTFCNLFSRPVGIVENVLRSNHKFRSLPPEIWQKGAQHYEHKQAYLDPKSKNLRYNPRIYTGGLLPRLKNSGSVFVKPYEPIDQWSVKRAMFGQNDYIDLLGDGAIHPKDFFRGPLWSRCAVNDLQITTRRLQMEGEYLKEFEKTTYDKLELRRIRDYQWVNQRRNIKFKKWRDKP